MSVSPRSTVTESDRADHVRLACVPGVGPRLRRRLLDLDDVGAPVGELAHRRRSGTVRGKVENVDVRKRKLGHGLHRPLKAGLRFSMKARRPSLKSSLLKQASAIFSSFL